MDRLVSLSVGTTGTEDYMRIFQDVSELARNMVDTHEYVNVSASVVGSFDEDEQECCDHEHLHYNEKTLQKVRKVLTTSLAPFGFDAQEDIGSLICAMQDAGILFRERKVEGNKR